MPDAKKKKKLEKTVDRYCLGMVVEMSYQAMGYRQVVRPRILTPVPLVRIQLPQFLGV